MKKLVILMVLVGLLFSLTGCGRAVQGALEDTAANADILAKKLQKHVDKANKRRANGQAEWLMRYNAESQATASLYPEETEEDAK